MVMKGTMSACFHSGTIGFDDTILAVSRILFIRLSTIFPYQIMLAASSCMLDSGGTWRMMFWAADWITVNGVLNSWVIFVKNRSLACWTSVCNSCCFCLLLIVLTRRTISKSKLTMMKRLSSVGNENSIVLDYLKRDRRKNRTQSYPGHEIKGGTGSSRQEK